MRENRSMKHLMALSFSRQSHFSFLKDRRVQRPANRPTRRSLLIRGGTEDRNCTTLQLALQQADTDSLHDSALANIAGFFASLALDGDLFFTEQ